MTPTSVGLVLVEGRGADGATVHHDAFDIPTSGRVTGGVSRLASAAVSRTEAIADAGGYRLHSIGLTWSSDADMEASLLLESLTRSGFDNVVAVRLPEATEALARGIGRVTGYDVTAVCVVEPEAVIVLVVDTRDGGVRTSVNNMLETDDDLLRWLAGVFDRDDWLPEALVVVGSAHDLAAITSRLERALSLPVFTPDEADVALARGAALAAAGHSEFTDAQPAVVPGDAHAGGSRSPLYIGALTMLVGGVLTLVVSLSIAVGLRLTPDKMSGQAEHRQVANTAGMPPVAQVEAPSVPPPAARVEPPPAEVPPPVPDAQPQLADPIPAAAPFDSGTVSPPPAALPEIPPADPPAAAPVPPPPPLSVPPAVPQAPSRHGPLLTRILDQVAPAVPAPPPDGQPPSP
jgi:hypothetical protein